MLRGTMLLAGLTAAALSLGLAACGGDDDDDGLPTGNVSKSAYIAKADAICADIQERYEPRIEALYEQAGTGIGEQQDLTSAELERLVNELTVPRVEEEVAALRELEAPESDAEKLEQLYDELEALADKYANDPASFARVDDYAPAQRIGEQLDAYGFEDC